MDVCHAVTDRMDSYSFCSQTVIRTLSHYSGGCSKDYIQIFSGPKDSTWYGTKFCRASIRSTFVRDNRATVYYHTDSSNTGYRTPPRGLRFYFSAIGKHFIGKPFNLSTLWSYTLYVCTCMFILCHAHACSYSTMHIGYRHR